MYDAIIKINICIRIMTLVRKSCASDFLAIKSKFYAMSHIVLTQTPFMLIFRLKSKSILIKIFRCFCCLIEVLEWWTFYLWRLSNYWIEIKLRQNHICLGLSRHKLVLLETFQCKFRLRSNRGPVFLFLWNNIGAKWCLIIRSVALVE